MKMHLSHSDIVEIEGRDGCFMPLCALVLDAAYCYRCSTHLRVRHIGETCKDG